MLQNSPRLHSSTPTRAPFVQRFVSLAAQKRPQFPSRWTSRPSFGSPENLNLVQLKIRLN